MNPLSRGAGKRPAPPETGPFAMSESPKTQEKGFCLRASGSAREEDHPDREKRGIQKRQHQRPLPDRRDSLEGRARQASSASRSASRNHFFAYHNILWSTALPKIV